MFLGRRFLQRTNVIASPAGPASNPREPLSFLYPRWARAAAGYLAPDGGGTQHAGIDSIGHVHSGQAPAVQEEEQESTTQVSSQLQNGACGDRSQNGSAMPWERDAEAIPAAAQVVGSNANSTKRVRRVARQAEGREKDRSFDLRSRGGTRGNARGKAPDAHIDWQTILRILQLHTPSYLGPSHDRGLRIMIPVGSVEQLIFSVDNNIWKIKERYGCEIELAEQEGGGSDSCPAIISGPVANVAKAAADILQITPPENQHTQQRYKYPIRFNTRALRNQTSPPEDGGAVSKYRHVLAEARGKMTSPLNVRQVTVPEVWTKESFENYVRHLTAITMSNHVRSILYEKGELHSEMVMKILRRLFSDPNYTDCITIAAANMALDYFVKKGQLRDVRRLYWRVATMNLRMGTETYNIMLRGAAKRKDLHTFRFMLELMLTRGYQPNGKTWIAFLRTLEDFDARKRTVIVMKRKGLFNSPGLIREACSLLIRRELQDFLESKNSRGNFWQDMEVTYSKHWFGLNTANQILDELGRRDLISRCLGVLTFMNHRGVAPNTDSLNFILKRCAMNFNWRGAIKVLEYISNTTNVGPNDVTYHSLFNLAWHYRFYNMARVVWQYACLDGATTDLMRERVKRTVRASIFNDHPKAANTPATFWNTAVGSFILGCMHLFPPQKSLANNYSKIEPKPEVHLGSGWNTESSSITSQTLFLEGATPEQINLYKDIDQQVRDDLRVFRYFLPAEPLITVLKAAVSVDVQMGHEIWKDPETIRRLMVTVPLIRKRNGLPGKTTMWTPGMRMETFDQDSTVADGAAVLALVRKRGDRLFYRRIKPKPEKLEAQTGRG